MKSINRNWFLGVAGCLALAAVWTIATVPENALAKGKPPKKDDGGGGFLSLCVTFDDFLGDDESPPNRIQSDGLDLDGNGVFDYCNKVDKVLAITGDGFRLATNSGGKLEGGIRMLFLDFRDPALNIDPVPLPPDFTDVDGDGVPEPFGFASIDMRIGTQYVSDSEGNLVLDPEGNRISAGTRLDPRGMTIGDTARADLNIKFAFLNDTSEQWMVSLGDPPGPDTCPDAAPVRVTRLTIDSWTIEATDVFEAGGDVACLRFVPRNKPSMPSGHFHMPLCLFMEGK